MKRIAYTAALFCLGLFSLIPSEAKAKKPFFGIHSVGMNGLYSGNGLDAGYIPQLTFRMGERGLWSAGPRIGLTGKNFSGLSTEMSIALMTEDESYYGHVRLAVYLAGQYFQNSSLGRSTIRFEKRLDYSPENPVETDYASLRYRGYEAGTGIAFSYRFDFGLQVQSRVGIGYYSINQTKGETVMLAHETQSVAMSVGAGLAWTFATKKKSARK